MATYTQQLILELLVKSDQFNKQLKDVSGNTKQASKDITSFKDSVSGALSFAASAGIGVGVVATIKKVTNAYGEFINQQATAQQVFGKSFDRLNNVMEESVERFGQSNSQFLQSTTLIAGLGKTAGIAGDDLVDFSVGLNTVAADLAAAFNTSTVDAIAAIQSGFSGSSIEPLRKYNIVLNDTILKQEYFALTGEKVTGVLTQQQRMAAFLSKLYQESADFQGQWDRESNQFLGTMQRLQATMGNVATAVGEGFEPSITAAANAIIPLIEGASSLNTELGGFPATLGLLAVGLFALRGPLGVVNNGIVTMGASISKTAPAFGNMVSTIGKFNPSMVALTALTIAFASASAQASTNANEWDASLKALASTTAASQVDDLSRALAALENRDNSSFENLTEWWTGPDSLYSILNEPFFGEGAEDIGTAVQDISKGFAKLAEDDAAAAQAILNVAMASDEGEAAAAAYGLSISEMEAAIKNSVTAQTAQKRQQDEINAILAESAGEVERNKDAWDNLADTFGEIADAASEAEDAISDLVDDAISKFTDQNDVEIARLTTLEAIDEWARTINTSLEEGESPQARALTNAENLASVYEGIAGQVDAAVAAQEALSGQELVGQERVDFITGFLDKLATDLPFWSAQINALKDDLTGDPIQLAIEASTTGAIDAVETLLSSVDGMSVIVDLLADAGVAEETIDTFIRNMGADKVIKVATEAIVTAAEDDITVLSDEERMTEIVVTALTDEAQDDIDEVTGEYGEYNTDIGVTANLKEFNEQIRIARQNAAKTLVIPVTAAPAGRVGTGTGGTTEPEGRAAEVGAVTMQQLAEGVTPTADDASFVKEVRRVAAVQAGQPIINNTTVYVTVPTSDPSATIRSIQRWSNKNGALPIMRGH